MKRRNYGRVVANAALSLFALAALAACGGEDDSTTGRATNTSATASATKAAELPTTGSTVTPPKPASTATTIPATATTVPATRKIGLAALDAIANNVLKGDTRAIVASVEYVELACDNIQGSGGPPQCVAGEAPGTKVQVFPFADCEGSYTRPVMIEALIKSQVADAKLHSAFKQKDQGTAAFPKGTYGVVFDIAAAGGRYGLMLGVNDAGKVVNVWRGCGKTAVELFNEHKGPEVLLAP